MVHVQSYITKIYNIIKQNCHTKLLCITSNYFHLKIDNEFGVLSAQQAYEPASYAKSMNGQI